VEEILPTGDIVILSPLYVGGFAYPGILLLYHLIKYGKIFYSRDFIKGFRGVRSGPQDLL
jgi:hypothetical protein